jgi:hypothetical protein
MQSNQMGSFWGPFTNPVILNNQLLRIDIVDYITKKPNRTKCTETNGHITILQLNFCQRTYQGNHPMKFFSEFAPEAVHWKQQM